jgi:hypothetical protein
MKANCQLLITNYRVKSSPDIFGRGAFLFGCDRASQKNPALTGVSIPKTWMCLPELFNYLNHRISIT